MKPQECNRSQSLSNEGDTIQKRLERYQDVLRKGLDLHEENKLCESARYYKACLEKNPYDALAWSNLGTIYREQGLFKAAISCGKKALELEPEWPPYLGNLANALKDVDRLDDALELHLEAVRQKPDSSHLMHNYAIALRQAARYEEALEFYERALKLDPENIKIQWDRAITYLHLGKFKEGWRAFEIRKKLGLMAPRKYKAPHWKGQKLKNKTIFIYAEQGFGDTILCARYIPLLKARGAKVVLECTKPLHDLFANIQGLSEIIEPGMVPKKFDYHAAMMSLPGVFGTNIKNIPESPRLTASSQCPVKAKKLLDVAGDKFKVGIVWSGSITFAGNKKRAVKPELFLPLTEIENTQFYSLQKGPCEGELLDCGGEAVIWELGPYLNSFAETAAVLKELDLVIMTDSSVAHLAGSMGVPVWNLLSYYPYWLYLDKREDSPWYTSMRIIRQTSAGDWDSVFSKTYSLLEKEVSNKRKRVRV